jgi:hypothetical protein
MKSLRLFLAAALILCAAPAFSRTWTDRFGSVTEGKFIRRLDDEVILQRGTKIIRIRYFTLSDEDKEYIEKQTEAKGNPSAKNAEDAPEVDTPVVRRPRRACGERTWTNDKGKKIQARLIRVEGEIAILLRDGGEVKAPLEHLSQADQDYIEEQVPQHDGGAMSSDDSNSPFEPAPDAPKKKPRVKPKPAEDSDSSDSDSPFEPAPSTPKTKPSAKQKKTEDADSGSPFRPAQSDPPKKQPPQTQPETTPSTSPEQDTPAYTPPPQDNSSPQSDLPPAPQPYAPPSQSSMPPSQPFSPPSQSPSFNPQPKVQPNSGGAWGPGATWVQKRDFIRAHLGDINWGIVVVQQIVQVALSTVIGGLILLFTCWLFRKMFGRQSIPMPNFGITAGISFSIALIQTVVAILSLLLFLFVCSSELQVMGVFLVAAVATIAMAIMIIANAIPTSIGKAIAIYVMQIVVVLMIVFVFMAFAGGLAGMAMLSRH